MNMTTSPYEQTLGNLFSVIGNPFRIKLLLAIGGEEVCVCHLEAFLGKRQAFISQHLMALRKEGLLETRREGKYIYYRLTDLNTLELIQKAGDLVGMENAQLGESASPAYMPNCPCPKCGSKNIVQISEMKELDSSE